MADIDAHDIDGHIIQLSQTVLAPTQYMGFTNETFRHFAAMQLLQKLVYEHIIDSAEPTNEEIELILQQWINTAEIIPNECIFN